MHHAVIFGAVANFAPPGVIAVLFSAFGVAAGGLDVAKFAGADPNIGPGGRNNQGARTIQIIFIADRLALGIDINKSAALLLAVGAGLGIIHPFESGLA